jgi:hypothetical protein
MDWLLTSDIQIFMDPSTKGDSKGDIIARGIVSEENARVIYERYVNPCLILGNVLLIE